MTKVFKVTAILPYNNTVELWEAATGKTYYWRLPVNKPVTSTLRYGQRLEISL